MSLYTLNRACILGRLGADAEGRFTQSGDHVMTLRVATDHGVKRNDAWENVTDWHSVVVWRKERLVEYLRKGSRVYVEGRLQTRKYTGKDNVERYSTEIVADNIIVLGNGKGEGDSGQHSADSSRQSASQPAPQYDGPITDDDVPF